MKPATLAALAPLLGATDLLVKTLGLSLVALPMLALLGVLATLLQRLDSTLRTLLVVLVACAVLSFADLLLHAWALELRQALGIFLPLLLVALLDAPGNAREGLRQGGTFVALALVLGALRESLGSGTVFSHADWLFGPAAGSWALQLPGFSGLPLFARVPGAFIVLGVLWALARSVLANSDSEA